MKRNPFLFLSVQLGGFFMLWLFLLRDFVGGKIPVNIDSFANYAVIKFFYDNLRQGVLPLWNPFIDAGQPFIYIGTDGIINPLQNALFLGLPFLGLNDYAIYMVYILFYFFVGLLGFFFLVKTIFKNDALAVLAYTLLLFSGLGFSVFNQISMIHVFVPAVWFFYFLLRFADGFHPKNFLGLTFSLMLVMNAYLPFYFITFLLVFTIAFACFFFTRLQEFLSGFIGFARKNILLLAVCFLALSVSLVPLLLYKFSVFSQESVAPIRHCPSISKSHCLTSTLANSAEMSFAEAQGGNLGLRFSFLDVFANLDSISYMQDGVFFIPIMCFILVVVSVFVYADKKLLFFCVLAGVVFLIGIAGASGMHKFLYDNIFYFKYFRNFFFFMTFLFPLVIIIAIQQLHALMKYDFYPSGEKVKVAWVVYPCLFLFFFFLAQQRNVAASALFTILGSAVWIFALMANPLRKRLLVPVLIFLSLVQPLEVLRAYSQNAGQVYCSVPKEKASPEFVFTRPPQKKESGQCNILHYFPNYTDFWHSIIMRDTAGILFFSANCSRWVFQLFMKMQPNNYLNYLKYKFIAYDQVKLFNEENAETGLGQMEEGMRRDENVAYISASASPGSEANEAAGAAPLKIEQESKDFQVLDFNVNFLKIRVHFAQGKFLVYNDSYYSDWKVSINDKPSPLYRANYAFKGIYLPPGENTVLFSYKPLGGTAIYYFILFFYSLFFVYLISFFVWRRNE